MVRASWIYVQSAGAPVPSSEAIWAVSSGHTRAHTESLGIRAPLTLQIRDLRMREVRVEELR